MFSQIFKKSLLKVSAAVAFASLLISPVTANATIAISNQPNIVGVATGSADFSTLVTAVKAAGLVDTLSGTDRKSVV